jgi:hypothetical protein
MKYTSVRDPRWCDFEQTHINCFVKFSTLKIEVPFTANPKCSEAHGREIFARCIAGDFGYVQPCDDVEVEKNPEATCFADTHEQVSPVILDILREFEEFLGEANAEVSRGSIRGIVLVWSSKIEQLLGQLLEGFLIDHTNSRSMIWSSGVLGEFSARAKTCFVLGLISKQDLNACNHIRDIRNFTAHEWNITGSNAKISDKMEKALVSLYHMEHSELFILEELELKSKITMLYAGSCAMLAIRLQNRLIQILSDASQRRTVWDPVPGSA